jgi:hypothetical protein
MILPHISIVRTILNTAKNKWEWIESVPHIKTLAESKLRIRWLTHNEANALLIELLDHLRAMAWFTLATGYAGIRLT